MTALIVIGSIVAVLLLLLLAPLSLDISYRRGEAAIIARYLFLRFDLLKERPEKEKKKRKAPAKEPAEEEGPEGEEEKGGGLKTVWTLVKNSRRGLGILRRHLVFSRVKLYIRVGGEDAHQAAMFYAKAGAAVRTALDILRLLFVLRKPKVAIAPDFTKPKTELDLSLRVGIRTLFALAAGASVFYRFLRANNEKKVRAQQIKGGKTA